MSDLEKPDSENVEFPLPASQTAESCSEWWMEKRCYWCDAGRNSLRWVRTVRTITGRSRRD